LFIRHSKNTLLANAMPQNTSEAMMRDFLSFLISIALSMAITNVHTTTIKVNIGQPFNGLLKYDEYLMIYLSPSILSAIVIAFGRH
jgi:hypothetical protein